MASKLNSERRRLIAEYGHLYSPLEYERIPGGLGCYYCGEPSGLRDHCPPLAWVDYKRQSDWKRDGIKFVLIPACDHCNRILGSRQLFTPHERAEFVASRLASIYEKECALWSDEEVAEMSKEFQRTIKARRAASERLLVRVRAAQWRAIRASAMSEE